MYYVLNLIAAMHARIENVKDRGATATEYALLVALIALVIVVGVGLFGTALNNFFSNLAGDVDNLFQ
jgi:pilus assembly protein Flp/PilA